MLKYQVLFLPNLRQRFETANFYVYQLESLYFKLIFSILKPQRKTLNIIQTKICTIFLSFKLKFQLELCNFIMKKPFLSQLFFGLNLQRPARFYFFSKIILPYLSGPIFYSRHFLLKF